jgi:hypothetical protein
MLNRPRILVLALALAAFAPAGLAQDPQDETPSLTTEDVKGPEPAVRSNAGDPAPRRAGAPTVDELWHEVYKSLSREGMPDADLAQMRSIIDGGGEVSLAVRFDVDAAGRIENFALQRQSGIGWIDRKIAAEASGNRLGPDVANFRDVAVDIGVSRGRLRATASLVAPTVEKATEIEELVHMLTTSGMPHTAAIPGITVSRTGASLDLSIDLWFEELMRGRAR